MKQITRGTPLQTVLELAPPCKCESCNHGCKYGSGFLVESGLKPLADFLKVSVEELKKSYLEQVVQFNKTLFRPKLERKKGMPYGKCTFYDENNGCSVHDAKPLQCKIAMGCKDYGEDLMLWFMLNHIIDADDPKAVKEYATYLKSGGKTLKGGKLNEMVNDKEKLKKMLRNETQ